MDLTTLKDLLEAALIIVGLPLAFFGVYRMQRREISTREETIHGLRTDFTSLQEKFRSYSDEVITKHRETWARIQEQEGALLAGHRQRTLESFGAQFAAFERKLLGVQDDLGHLRGNLLGAFEDFYDHRRHALLTREAAGATSWELLAETRQGYMEDPFVAGAMQTPARDRQGDGKKPFPRLTRVF